MIENQSDNVENKQEEVSGEDNLIENLSSDKEDVKESDELSLEEDNQEIRMI